MDIIKKLKDLRYDLAQNPKLGVGILDRFDDIVRELEENQEAERLAKNEDDEYIEYKKHLEERGDLEDLNKDNFQNK